MTGRLVDDLGFATGVSTEKIEKLSIIIRSKFFLSAQKLPLAGGLMRFAVPAGTTTDSSPSMTTGFLWN